MIEGTSVRGDMPVRKNDGEVLRCRCAGIDVLEVRAWGEKPGIQLLVMAGNSPAEDLRSPERGGR